MTTYIISCEYALLFTIKMNLVRKYISKWIVWTRPLGSDNRHGKCIKMAVFFLYWNVKSYVQQFLLRHVSSPYFSRHFTKYARHIQIYEHNRGQKVSLLFIHPFRRQNISSRCYKTYKFELVSSILTCFTTRLLSLISRH